MVSGVKRTRPEVFMFEIEKVVSSGDYNRAIVRGSSKFNRK